MARKKEVIIEEKVEEIIEEKKKGGSRKKFEKKYGSRAEVWHGNAEMTTGGLRKSDLKHNKQGVLVSKKMSDAAKKKDILKRLKQ